MDLRQFASLVFLISLKGSIGQPRGCPRGKWQCDDGHCVPYEWRCDNEGDCLDGSDEMDCNASPVSIVCPPGHFACTGSAGCVKDSARCDGQRQCPSGSDEEGCVLSQGCLDSDWTCKNQICIPTELRCDGENDCLDNSDEQGCVMCEENNPQCPEGKCLSADEWCDGKAQCSDGSDEPSTCGRRCNEGNGGCSHVCVDEPWGAMCACPMGYEVSANGAGCEDMDECAQPFSPCTHHCVNTAGSFYCHCQEGFTLNGTSTCLATGNAVKLLTLLKGSIRLLNLKSQQFEVIQATVSKPLAMTFDMAKGYFYWADEQGSIYKTDGQKQTTLYSGEPGISSLACDWLNGHIYWTNVKSRSIHVGAADGSGYTTLLGKGIGPLELVLLPLESLLFWINTGPGDRMTLEKSWMDCSDRISMVVLTAQEPHSLVMDVAARRLYWISDFKKTVETVKVDGSGRFSFTGLLGSKPAFSLAVFENWLYWTDSKGLWRSAQSQPKNVFLQKALLPMITMYHEQQQPNGFSACNETPCKLCLLSRNNPAGFTCTCPGSKLLLPDRTCDYPRFVYATATSVSMVAFKERELSKAVLFTTEDGIRSFDVDWYRNWLYWTNRSGQVKRSSLTEAKTEMIPSLLLTCIIKVDQRTGKLFWVSCDQTCIGVTASSGYPRQLYSTKNQVRDLYLDWLKGGLLWLEGTAVFSMSQSGDRVKELLKLGGDVKGHIAFDMRASNLLWYTEGAGLSVMSLLQGRIHQDVGRWNVSGSVEAAFEPYILSLSDDVMTLWDQRDGRTIQQVNVEPDVFGVSLALNDVKPVPSAPICKFPSVLCPPSMICLSPSQRCDGKRDCPDGSDEDTCVTTCPKKGDFNCKDRRSCVPRGLVCDGRAHCLDGSDELNCPTVMAAVQTSQAVTLKCRMAARPCRDNKECVLYNHVCDGERDCKDGSDEQGCDAEKLVTPSVLLKLRPSAKATSAPQPSTVSHPACVSPSVLCPNTAVPLCIAQTQLCDRRKDCPDGFDEQNCVSRCPVKSDFRCKDRRSCVSQTLVCDGRAHCHDASDEAGCPAAAASPAPVLTQAAPVKCRLGSWPCQDGTQCVLLSHVCDGERDCRDGSDEEQCSSEVTTTAALQVLAVNKPVPPHTTPLPAPLLTCASPTLLCPDSSACIFRSHFCDGRRDCADGSDEDCVTDCPYKTDFRCKDWRSCVSQTLVCDGRAHCHDASDEVGCMTAAPPAPVLTQAGPLKCFKGSRPCRDGRECVLHIHLCDGERDCSDGSDEEECETTCSQEEFQCSHGRMCLPLSQKCDGKPQCQDRSDELDCWKPTKSCHLHCDDNKLCIPASFLCDGERDCRDGSDEKGCIIVTTMVEPQAPVCIAPSLRCPGSAVCISPNQICDEERDCPDGYDEHNCLFKCQHPDDFLCRDGRACVAKAQVCDGRAHCADGSDEARCLVRPPVTSPTPDIVVTRPSVVTCRKGSKLCKDGRECVLYTHLCDGESDCLDGSDEEGCISSCEAAEFQCAHGKKCIPQDLRCDGTKDCQDGSDEVDCVSRSENCHHHCDNGTRCVPQTFLCDGEKDCSDGSDEMTCGTQPCAISQYSCTSGQCVPEALRCDGYADCHDRSDEVECSKAPRCPTQLQCPNSHECLQKEWLCDGEKDCKDGSDEKNCTMPPVKCREYQWQCGEGNQCVPLSWRCDGDKDCHNGADEYKCGDPGCPPQLYQCSSGECVDPALVCNRITNCADGSDEGSDCALRNCSSAFAPRCDHHCVSTPHGAKCICASGFRLQLSGVSCADVDECNQAKRPACKHLCLNTRGSYVCRCHPGFLLEPDQTSCKTADEPLLLASVQSELLLLNIHSAALRLLSSAARPVFSLDYHWGQQRTYWLSPDYQSIRWAQLPDFTTKGTLVKGVKSDFIAVDWIGNNLYWVDGLLGQILAVRLGDATVKPQNYTVVLDKDLEQPSSLVLLPHRGLMLWSEIGRSPQIERAAMDGSKRKVVVSHGLSWPVSLVVDLLDSRLYWADEKQRCIGSATLDGDDVKILQLEETPSPFSVAVFNDQLFWSDTKRRTIRSADKTTGKNQKVLLKRPGQPFGIKLMHPLSQPAVASPCEQVKCSHLCLLAPGPKARTGVPWTTAVEGITAVCRCPAGLLLAKDKVTCSPPVDSAFILLLSPTTITQLFLHTILDGTGLKKVPSTKMLALPGVVEASGLDVAVDGLTVYVSDAAQGSVDLLRLRNSGAKADLMDAGRILHLNDEAVTALAVDWVTGSFYWSSTKRPDLHVTSLNSKYTAALLQGSLKGTSSIAVHPPTGLACYTALGLSGGRPQAQVDCCHMDGRNRVVLWRKTTIPSSLVFCNKGATLYWADIGELVIGSIAVDGSGYKQYKTGPGLIISFTRIETMLLWVTQDKDVTRLWFSDGLQPKQMWFEAKTTIVALKAYSKDSQTGTSSCTDKNGGCSQLCLAYPGGRTCRCGQDFLAVNVTACVPLPTCPPGSDSCTDASKCVPSAAFCDGRYDCPDQSDEWDCASTNADTRSSKGLQAGKTPFSSQPLNQITPVQSVEKDAASCDLQRCGGHGTCVQEAGGPRCQCTAGYAGEFCQEDQPGGSHVSVVMGVLCVVLGLAAAAFLFHKRKLALKNTSIEKATLMSNMEGHGAITDLAVSDSEDLDSPIDTFPPLRGVNAPVALNS